MLEKNSRIYILTQDFRKTRILSAKESYTVFKWYNRCNKNKKRKDEKRFKKKEYKEFKKYK